MNPKSPFRICFLILLSCSVCSITWATKLFEVRPVDESHLMIHLRDGENKFSDDGKRSSAYDGHVWAEGDDNWVIYGQKLDTKSASKPSTWVLSSKSDDAYGPDGKTPMKVFRKSKVMETDIHWNYQLHHWIFLKLPSPMKSGSTYHLRIDPATECDTGEVEFTFDDKNSWSEAIHVNLIGYTPDSPVKSADLYMWLGDGGPRDYSSFEGKPVWIQNQQTSDFEEVGTVSFWKNNGLDAGKHNLIGSDVWNVDFSDFRKPGTFRLFVEGIGGSPEFVIREDAYFEPFKTSLRGYYYMRIGEDRMDMVPVPRRPLFIQDKDPEAFKVYLTDLQPYHPLWSELRKKGDVWDEPHFKKAETSIFYQHRLPGNPTNARAVGGHSDALDWDRHLGHVSNIYDILLPYILSQGKIDNDDLNIAESGNGIPDVIDEARNEVDFWLNLRDGDAYCHGITNPDKDRRMMFQAGKTNMAAWANAANAAMLAESFRIAGRKELANYYCDEAIKAYRFAEKDEQLQLDDVQEIGEMVMRGRDFQMMASAFLYNLTGEREWEDAMARESVVHTKDIPIEKEDGYCQIWGTVAYLLSPHPQHYQDLLKNMKASVIESAEIENVQFMDQRPSRRSSNDNYWQTIQNLHLVMIGHAISDDEQVKERFLKSMTLEADWGLGRNPGNLVEMTGLGSRCIVNCYTAGRNDGTPGLHPGHTPYNNLDPWGKDNIGSMPQWFTERGYPDWEKGGWPHQEAHFNSRYSWTNGEFTPRQTMRGKMALYGYLYSLSK